jgi:hypothetical protein
MIVVVTDILERYRKRARAAIAKGRSTRVGMVLPTFAFPPSQLRDHLAAFPP